MARFLDNGYGHDPLRSFECLAKCSVRSRLWGTTDVASDYQQGDRLNARPKSSHLFAWVRRSRRRIVTASDLRVLIRSVWRGLAAGGAQHRVPVVGDPQGVAEPPAVDALLAEGRDGDV